jgi:signal transduction histidine kinase
MFDPRMDSNRYDADTGRSGQPETDQTVSGREQRASHLAFVAHEVRNPLSTALWSTQLLARMSQAERGAARGEKLLGMCLRSLSRVRFLIEDHFLSERLDVDGIPIHCQPVSIDKILVEVAGQCRLGGVSCSLKSDPTLMIWADPALLAPAIEAVLLAAGRGGMPVGVDVRAEEKRVVMQVEGAPQPGDALADPGRQSASDVSGRALGLATARRVASAMGGSLAVVQGRFLFCLPVDESGQNGGRESVPPPGD